MAQFHYKSWYKRFGWLVLATAVTFLLLSTLAALAAPGDLDATFGNGGLVTTNFGSADIGTSIALQPDGKILIAGHIHNGSNFDLALVRYESNGDLDATFGSGGLVTTAFGNGTDYGSGMTLQPDGKILVTGSTHNGSNYDFSLARYEIDGDLDVTFGAGGKITTTFFGNGNDHAYHVTLQPDGKILAIGYSHNGSNYDFALARYDSNGSLDTTFGAGGKVTTAIGSSIDYAYSATLQPDGKILVAGTSHGGSSFFDFALARYNGDGSLDTSFDGDGRVVTAFGSIHDIGSSVTLQSDGKILVAGVAYINSGNDFALARYDTNGSLDTAFDGDGKVTTNFGNGTEYGRSVAVQPNGKILVAGQGNDHFALARYESNGALDATFGNSGMVTTGFGNASNGLSLMLQPDGKILVAGYAYNGSNDDLALARYEGFTPNQMPVAHDDSYLTDEDTPFTTGNVMENDSDPDGDPLGIESIDLTGTTGEVTNNGDGTFVYDPNSQFEYLAAGEIEGDTFQYTIADSQGLTATAVVTITINGVNDAPVALADTAVTPEDAPLNIPVLANDFDPDASDTFTVTTVSSPINGTTMITGTTVFYMPDLNFNGVEVFSYTVSDGHGGTASAMITVTVEAVNDSPVAQDDTSSTDEETAVTTPNVLANDTDVDGNPLTVQSLIITGTLGQVTNNGDGTFGYDPNDQLEWLAVGETAIDVFAYVVSDSQGGTDTAVVTITINGVNDQPVALADTADTPEDTPRHINVLGNDVDPDASDTLTLTAVIIPTNGTAAIDGMTVLYTPQPDFNGTDVFSYTVGDDHGGQDSAVVTVTVGAVNDAPIAVDDEGITDEDTAVTVPVLLNDIDPDGDTLSILHVGQPMSGAAVIQGSAVFYTPAANFYGTDVFSYTVGDGALSGTAFVTITVNAVNDPPAAADDFATIRAGATVTIAVLANDTDPVEGSPLIISAVADPLHGTAAIVGTAVIYTPAAGFLGMEQFTYTISDGEDTATATITVIVTPQTIYLPLITNP